ncbi:hypothetical protein [Halalkalibacterium ligniniphilum]|uniref:hypothetical protein n=1 Tax=Halalkalibacterium ligniniphilum TaxID=1134413 RepID=UPI00034BE218|nr:hypothetical protein [Halalkalibacterium ligniniphilum]
MSEFIFFIDGHVNHPLTIDPSVWIFDERKVDLTTYFKELPFQDDVETAYKKAISAQWDKEITEGSEPPRPNSNGNELKYEKQKLMNGTFGMPFRPFLLNAEPLKEAKNVTIHTADGELFTYEFEVAASFILGFSKQGKPLKEDGPVHVYLGDGSNEQNPIRQVTRFTVGI